MTLRARDLLALAHADEPMGFSIAQEERGTMIYLLIGLPGAGKSTIARKLQKEIGAIIIGKDIIRYEMLGEEYNAETEEMVHSMFKGLYTAAIVYERDIILDGTHITRETRRELVDIAKAYRVPIMAVAVSCEFEESWRRKQETGTGMAWSVFVDKTREYEPPLMDEGFYEVAVIDNSGCLTDDALLTGKGERTFLKSGKQGGI